MDEDTLLAVFGDHGMTEIGDHGGDSTSELETLLFFYSKKSLFDKVIVIFGMLSNFLNRQFSIF